MPPDAPPPGDDIEFSRRQWFYRRRIAFTALWASIVLLFVVLGVAVWSDAAATRLDKFQMFLATGISGLFALVGTYMGLATWQDVRVPMTPPRGRGSPPRPFGPRPPERPCPVPQGPRTEDESDPDEPAG